MISITQMRQVRQALNDAGLGTPFTSRVKRGFSIKLTGGKSTSPEMSAYLARLIGIAMKATEKFDNIEIKKTQAMGTYGQIQQNVVVRIVTPKA